VQGHKVHVVGMGEMWGRELPGVTEDRGDRRKESKERAEKMKIAWRYEGLGQFESSRGACLYISSANTICFWKFLTMYVVGPSRTAVQSDGTTEELVFCHTFDLAKRLTLPVGTAINYIPIPPPAPSSMSVFPSILHKLRQQLASSPVETIHRLIMPSLLSPALYPSSSAHPSSILQFLHGLRALLRQYSTRLTAILTLPLTLFPRSAGIVRWMEILSDGVFELSPFPYSHAQALAQSAGTTKDEERPQGMFAVHKLPIFHEKGGGGGADDLGEDMAFTLSRRKFVVAKFSLPPLEGDTEAQEQAVREAAGGSAMPKKADLEF
jgi:elongator complex protein 4